MREKVFIADEVVEVIEPAERDAMRAAASLAEKAEAVAKCVEWLSTLDNEPEQFRSLASEWADLRGSVPVFSERTDRYGRTVYTCESDHGKHESLQSRDHAFFLLVDSHRTRIEDLPETRARLEALGFSPKEALQRCQAIGRDVAKANGRMPIAQHDALVEAEIQKLENPPPAEEKR